MVFVDGSFYVVDQITGKIWRSGRMRPLARPILGSVLYRGNTTELTFSTVPGFRYTIERANELDGLPWLSFSGSILAISNNLTFAGPALESRQYYRVRTE
jgi:hypothetical protein